MPRSGIKMLQPPPTQRIPVNAKQTREKNRQESKSQDIHKQRGNQVAATGVAHSGGDFRGRSECHHSSRVNLIHTVFPVPPVPSWSPLPPLLHRPVSLFIFYRGIPPPASLPWFSPRLLAFCLPGSLPCASRSQKPRSPLHHPCTPRRSVLLLRGRCPQSGADSKR